jgi:catechol 2,3-dioxygenase-like lactoylglutathione lyase family enzyme
MANHTPHLEPAPPLLGLSHVSLSVNDLDAAVHFWTEVMGFEALGREPAFCFLIERDARLAVVVADHLGTVTGPFDERHTGLDHLALAVPDVAALRSWERRLTRLGVTHSGVTESDGGHHLNLRAPDGVPVELFVIAPAMLASLGLAEVADAVAGGHA